MPAQLDTIFETVMIDGPLLFHCERVSAALVLQQCPTLLATLFRISYRSGAASRQPWFEPAACLVYFKAALFVYDSSRDEVWSKAVFGQDEAIRMHKSKSKSIVTWVIDNKDILNTADAPQVSHWRVEANGHIRRLKFPREDTRSSLLSYALASFSGIRQRATM